METRLHTVQVDGWPLGVSEFPAAGRARGVVVAGHAMMANRRTLDRPRGQGLASTLAAAGLHVYTFDVRGHGESGPAAADGGRWSYDDVVNRDIPAMVAWARARHPDLRLGVLGHSLVGHGALLWLGVTPEAPVDALVLYAANLWLRQCEPRPARWLRKRAMLALWMLLSRPLGYFPARRIRFGTDDEPISLVRDFLRWARTDGCTRISDGADYLAGRARVKQPVLAFVGEKDDLLCVEECSARFLAPVPDHAIRRVPGADHMTLVTRESSRPAWEQTAAWFLEQLDRRSE